MENKPELLKPEQLNKFISFPASQRAYASHNKRPQFDGPLSSTMWKKVAALKSTYVDSFDWGVYDRIHERFGPNQPRGGVTFKTTFKLVNHHTSCSKCHYAFEIDSYGRGCVHNCSYCYAKDQLTSHGYWNRPMPFPIDLSEIRKIMHTVFETDKKSKWRDILSKRIPVRIGSMSDSFMWMDRKYGVSKELLKIFNFYKYPHIVFTRSDLIAEDEYLEVLNKELVSIQMSISGNNEMLTKLIEPGAPSIKRRLAALKKLAENGYWTTARINPMFPVFPDGYFTDSKSITERFGSRDNVPKFEMMNDNFLDDLQAAKVPSIVAGFVRLSSKAINDISETVGVNLKSFFKPELVSINGDKRYSDSEIAYYYLKLRAGASKRKIRFNTCYIGNGQKDYHQYQSLWDNRSDCCDAKGNLTTFKNSCQSIPWNEREKHAPMRSRVQFAQEQEAKIDKAFKESKQISSIIFNTKNCRDIEL